jgi:hypothetical protein
MSFKKFSADFFVFGWIMAVLLPGGGVTAQEKRAPAGPPKSLIRKELLVPRAGELPFPRRNIFSPDSGSSEIASPPVVQAPRIPGEEPPGAEANPDQPPAETTLNITYLGFINSSKTRIGLILLEGEPVAVREGESLRQGYKVEKITPKEIELTGPDSKTHKFPLARGKGENS